MSELEKAPLYHHSDMLTFCMNFHKIIWILTPKNLKITFILVPKNFNNFTQGKWIFNSKPHTIVFNLLINFPPGAAASILASYLFPAKSEKNFLKQMAFQNLILVIKWAQESV